MIEEFRVDTSMSNTSISNASADVSLNPELPAAVHKAIVLRRRNYRWIFYGLVGLAVIAFFTFLPLVTRLGPRGILSAFLFTPYVTLCCLFGAVAGLSSIRFRWPAAAMLTVLVGGYAGMIIDRNTLLLFEIFSLGIAAVVATTTLSLRLFCGEFCIVEPGQTRADALQFKITDIMIWTTVIAGIIGILRLVMNLQPSFEQNLGQITYVLMISVSLAVSAVTSIWAFLGTRVTLVKSLVVVGVTLAAFLFNSTVLPFRDEFFSTVVVVNQIFICIGMLVLRGQGFRFVKRT